MLSGKKRPRPTATADGAKSAAKRSRTDEPTSTTATTKATAKAKKAKATEAPSSAGKGKGKGKGNTNPDAANNNGKRYILFAGNLPYDVTKEALMNHFKTEGEVKDCRLLTKRDGRPRGCAFVELEDDISLQRCLKLHHSWIEGEGGDRRQLNVEMSAGGGGKSFRRMKNIRKKNARVRQQAMRIRQKKAQREAQQAQAPAKA